MILRELEGGMDQQVLSRRKFIFFCVILFLAGCEVYRIPVDGKNAEEVYLEAENLLREGDFEDAGKKFRDVDTYFPCSSKASTAQIMSAYCSFRSGSYEDSIRELDVFLRYHPSHGMVPYSLYLKALSKYMMMSKVGRDSTQAKDAKKVFIELINRFPTSKYAKDSQKRIVILDDILAAHELVVGRYYQKKKSYLAAINRYNCVVSRFPNTKSAEEAFFRITECCRNEGLLEEENNAASVLKAKFPNGKWVKKLDKLKR